MKAKKRSKVPLAKQTKHGYTYVQLWRIADGAVADAFKMHPDYLTTKGHRHARTSIVKRIAGALMGYATEAQRANPVVRGRS